MTEVHARIDQDAFARLVRGEIVDLIAAPRRHVRGAVTVRLILADIGFAQMLLAINRARDGCDDRHGG